MTIKSSQELVENALQEIKTLSVDDALKLVQEDKCNLVDIRDIRELDKQGRIDNSAHIPRGMLEFWMDPQSEYFKNGKIDQFLNKISLKNIVIETDSPYLAPVPYRGKRNEPAYVIHTARIGADIFEISYEEFALQTESNFTTLFNKILTDGKP